MPGNNAVSVLASEHLAGNDLGTLWLLGPAVEREVSAPQCTEKRKDSGGGRWAAQDSRPQT